jgi:NADPH:quinone reductase-like Zn-dependent oxidoreductase
MAGGRGKSTMAKVLFNRVQQEGNYPLSAFVKIQIGDGADKTAHHLATALKALGAKGEATDGEEKLADKLKDFVADKKVLLVLDNVQKGSQLAALFPLQLGEGSAVIITSRSRGFADTPPSWRTVCTVELVTYLPRMRMSTQWHTHVRTLARDVCDKMTPP